MALAGARERLTLWLMTPRDRLDINRHLKQVIAANVIENGPFSPVRLVFSDLRPLLARWGRPFVDRIEPSGSFSKGTAVRGGTDIDVFVSLRSTLDLPLRDIYERLFSHFDVEGFAPRRQNVSVGIRCRGYSVDVTPARRQAQTGNFHSLFSNRTGAWLQTNVQRHRVHVSSSGRLDEIRLFKIWRNRFGLDWPSFYLELFVIDALQRAPRGALFANIPIVLEAVRDRVALRRLVDPANSNNVVSDTLDATEKAYLSGAAARALNMQWEEVFQ